MKLNSEEKYKEKLYKKIHLELLYGKVLDVGCGNGEDAFFVSKFAKSVYAFDIDFHRNWKKYKKANLHFQVADAEHMPFRSKQFDSLFVKDVLHHVNNPKKVLREIDRVTHAKSTILILEGNRYNPIFYIHMTKLRGHEHLSKTNFKKLIASQFKNVKFNHFESHYYPTENKIALTLLQLQELLMEKLPVFNKLLSYNLAIIQK